MTAPLPVVGTVPDATLADPEVAPGSLIHAITDDPDALVYFLVNVGDGDTQLLLLPPDSSDGIRRLVIVDVATPGKLPKLIDALSKVVIGGKPLIEPPGSERQIRLLVATHPHFDHIGGMSDLIATYGNPNPAVTPCIEMFWEPGYFFPSASFHNLMASLESTPRIRRLQPTSGTTMTLDSVRFMALGPGIGLRNRFDTYGVEINDSSITMMVEYPANALFAETSDHGLDRRAAPIPSRRLLLGGDAQFTSWAQATVDFPDLVQEQNPTLAKELRSAQSRDYLAADLIKISHHASKHGVNIELLERVGASTALVSSVAGGGKYGFPHLLAMEAAREARQPTTTNSTPRKSDQELGIHVTGSKLDTGKPAGSIAVVVSKVSGRALRLFRFGDSSSGAIDLTAAREVK